MKKFFSIVLLSALCFVACSESTIDEQSTPTIAEGEPIAFSVVSNEGRASYFQGEGHGVVWDGGEQIGIRAYDIDTPSSNKQRGNYTVAKNGECTLNKHDGILWQGSPMTITAYYPATNNATASNLWEIPMSDKQVQKAAGDHSHIANYMVMQAEPQDFTQQPDAAQLEFCNLCAIVELTIKGSASHTVRRVTLSTTSENHLSATQLKLDATQSLFDNKGDLKAKAALVPYTIPAENKDFGSKQLHLSLTSPAALSEDGANFYLVVLPGKHENEEITISIETTEGKIAEKKMGAIEFKMNKVYRPTISFNDSDFKISLAEIKHHYSRVNGNTYSTPIPFVEEAVIFLDRTYKLYNVPSLPEPCEVATCNSGLYPSYNRIIAENDGYVYLLTDGNESVFTQMEGFGWEPVTACKGTNDATTFGSEQMYYNSKVITSGTASGILTLYRRWMLQGEEFDLKRLTKVTSFRGIRPVAKKIHGAYYDDATAAEIEIAGIDTTAPYFGSVNYENGATIIATRTQTNGHSSTMVLDQIPLAYTHSEDAPWQTMALPNTACPDVTITAKTAGKVYMTTTGASTNVNTALTNAGWSLETTLSSVSKTEAIRYSDGSSTGYYAIWSKVFEQGESLALADFKSAAFGTGKVVFQGVRPVAKKITWPLAKMEVEQVTDGALTTFEAGNSLTTKVATTICKSDQKSLPSGYLGMSLYAVNGQGTTTTVYAKAVTAGMVYAIYPESHYPTGTNTTARDAMDGWKQIESFYCTDGNLYYLTAKYVAKDEIVSLAYSKPLTRSFDRMNGNVGILMGDLTLTDQPLSDEILVSGNLIDIRPFTPSPTDSESNYDKCYPQHANYLLPADIESVLGAGYSYAVGLAESRGPESFTTKQSGVVYLALSSTSTPSGWSKSGKSFKVSSTYSSYTYTIYQRTCAANETVEIPKAGNASAMLIAKRLRIDAPTIPGVIIAKMQDDGFRKRHVTNVNIHILPDGSYLTLCTNTLYSRSTTIYRSTDKGKTWSLYSTPTKMNFTRLFEHNGALYIMGTESDGELIICKSTDNGKTWTKPDATTRSGYIDLGLHEGTEKVKGHQAPTTMAIWDGRIWRAMENHNDDDNEVAHKNQQQIYPFVISAPVDSDLLDPASWSYTNTVFGDKSYYKVNGYTISRLIEGNVVVGPDGKLYNLLRASSSGTSSVACLARVEKNGSSYELQVAASDFITMPGGGKKFVVIYDEVSGLYWSLTNPADESENRKYKHNGVYSAGITVDLIRNRVALYSSPDLRNWTLRRDNLLYNADPFFHGFQYIDWKIDGNDIVFVSRTAIPEERGLPIRQHDANMMTFHRIKNFRN